MKSWRLAGIKFLYTKFKMPKSIDTLCRAIDICTVTCDIVIDLVILSGPRKIVL